MFTREDPNYRSLLRKCSGAGLRMGLLFQSQMIKEEIQAKRAHMAELNSAAQDLVDAGHFDPDAVKEQTVVMEQRWGLVNTLGPVAVGAGRKDRHPFLPPPLPPPPLPLPPPPPPPSVPFPAKRVKQSRKCRIRLVLDNAKHSPSSKGKRKMKVSMTESCPCWRGEGGCLP